MRKVGHIIRKEFIQLRRDRRMFFIIFFSPVLQLILLGYAANLDIKNIPVVFCDLDSSPASRDFIARFPSSGYFTVEATLDRIDDVDAFIDRGEASLALIIPRGMGRRLAGQKPVSIQVIVDGAESQTAVIGLNYATMIGLKYSRQILIERLEQASPAFSPPKVEPVVRIWYNPELRSRNFMIPGVLAMVLMIVTMMLTSLGIVKEREQGTMEQLMVTPIRAHELILGKLLPFFFIGLIEIGVVVAVAVFWFGVPVKGSIWLLFALSPTFMLTTLGLGLFISTISRNQQQAMLTAVFFILPQIILSGFVFPIENMPRIIQGLTYVVPLRYFLVIIRGLFLKAAGWGALWDETAALVVFGMVILGLSVLRFRKNLE
ncbi:MAG: ABC transporter permease [Candidatus Aminicenantes bacterium]|nr:ABC transporter permease [Candidatus Aminicenantes bacterium]